MESWALNSQSAVNDGNLAGLGSTLTDWGDAYAFQPHLMQFEVQKYMPAFAVEADNHTCITISEDL